jgi:hypothetical protein
MGRLLLTWEGFALWQGGEELRIATSGQRLIALLALRDRPAGRLHVAGTLWPDYPTDRSLADLRTTLWRMRQACDRVVAGLHVRPTGIATSTSGRILIAAEPGVPPSGLPERGVFELDPVNGQPTAASVDGLFGNPIRLAIAP